MFGSSWGQNQQNQQPQQNQQAFGQTNSGFGAFGGQQQQQQQQQQPAANPMFGSMNPAPTGGFGAFGGGANTQNNASASIFGAPKPTGGFGAFGGGGTTPGASTFGGGGGAFGQPANTGTTTGVFGSTATNTGAFGSTGAFGAAKPAGTFGATPTQAGGDAVGPVTTGSSNPPYAPHSEKETPTSNNMIAYQSISCMPAYRGTSFEEVRCQDYAQGRKTASAAPAFGQQTNAFGAAQPTTSTFGQPAQQNQPAPSIFGSTNNTTNTGGGFGTFGQQQQQQPQTNTSTGFGAFGQTQQQQPAQSTGFGTFGQNQQQQQPQQPAAGAFGGFGTAKPAQPAFGATTGGAFGAGNTSTFGQNTQQTTGAFGQPAAQSTPAFGGAFGANNNAPKPSIFGQPAQPAAGGFGTFGQPQQQQQQPAQSTSIFGSGGAFGQQNQQQNQQPAQQQSSIFGSTPAQPAATGGFGSMFGNNAQQPQQAAQGQPAAQTSGFGGLFNKPATPTTQTGGGLFSGFGQSTNQATTAPQTGLFGASTLGQPSAQQPSTGLFGAAKPAAPSIAPTQSTMMGTPSMFGNGGFGQTNNFQASTLGGNTQGTLTASIAQPIDNNLAIFQLLPPGPRAVSVDPFPAKKKPGFFVDVPTRSPVPRVQLGYAPANSKLRGFASTTAAGSSTSNPFGASYGGSSMKTANGLSMSRAGSTPLAGRAGSPSLGTGGRQSVKKLILDKRVEPSDLFARSSRSMSPAPNRAGISFSPALGVAAREKEAAAAATPAIEAPVPTSRHSKASNRFTAADGDNSDLKDGDYWSKPDLRTLVSLSHAELRSCKNLVVGRIGYGEIHFLEPVDLTGLNKLRELYGEVVRLEDKECSVYPEIDDSEKPAPGTHLNVRARIILSRCWPTDKATREPIKDEKHPSMIRHMKKLKGMRDTNFESYDSVDGTWVFSVDHF